MPDRVIMVRESEWREMREALAKCAEGWGNAVELDLLPPSHHAAATYLRDEARAALSHPAPQPSGWQPEVGNRFIAGVNPEGQPRAWLRLDDMPSVGSVIEMLEEWERTDPKRRLVITDSVERTFPAVEGGDDG